MSVPSSFPHVYFRLTAVQQHRILLYYFIYVVSGLLAHNVRSFTYEPCSLFSTTMFGILVWFVVLSCNLIHCQYIIFSLTYCIYMRTTLERCKEIGLLYYHFGPICTVCQVLSVLWAVCPANARACTALPCSAPSCDFYGPMGHCTELSRLFSWHKVC